MTAFEINIELCEALVPYYDDPLGFVRFAFPWGKPGLADCDGPDTWQREVLAEIGRAAKGRGFDGKVPVDAIRVAIASGHGIGKTVLVAWLVIWIMSTRPYAQGTVTANTLTQLETKTWATIQKWAKLSCTADWWNLTGNRMEHKQFPESWFCTAQTCREQNSEAFAGQHAANSTSFYIFDEASAISEKIWEVAEGGLTDGSPMIFALGNPTRSQGKFHRICFGSEQHRWHHRSIDSRTSRITNKEQIEQWIQDYGEDSDFVRVRVRGLPPRASDLQYIDAERVYQAQKREATHFPDDPLVVGLDVARGGAASSVFRFRRGLDAQSIPAIRIPGEECRDSMRLVSVLVEVLNNEYDGVKPTAVFVDSGFGGPIVDRANQLGYDNVYEVQFGGKPPDVHFANMRAWMWGKVRDWLPRGSIDKLAELEMDLTGPGYHHDKQDRLVLESKEDMQKRGLASPDDGDALALTFAQTVEPLSLPLSEAEELMERLKNGMFSGSCPGGAGSWMT